MKDGIAFFDFDGTITSKDTMFELIKYRKGKLSFYLGLIQLSPWLIAMKLRLLSNTGAKEKLLSYFFHGTPHSDFQNACNLFIQEKLPNLVRPEALQEIAMHKKNKITVVVVSASAENWISGWCDQHQILCIGTKLEIRDGVITGKIDGKNCNGIEKVRRIKERYPLHEFKSIWAYGDTKGDKPMLSLAAFPNYKPFRKKPPL